MSQHCSSDSNIKATHFQRRVTQTSEKTLTKHRFLARYPCEQYFKNVKSKMTKMLSREKDGYSDTVRGVGCNVGEERAEAPAVSRSLCGRSALHPGSGGRWANLRAARRPKSQWPHASFAARLRACLNEQYALCAILKIVVRPATWTSDKRSWLVDTCDCGSVRSLEC